MKYFLETCTKPRHYTCDIHGEEPQFPTSVCSNARLPHTPIHKASSLPDTRKDSPVSLHARIRSTPAQTPTPPARSSRSRAAANLQGLCPAHGHTPQTSIRRMLLPAGWLQGRLPSLGPQAAGDTGGPKSSGPSEPLSTEPSTLSSLARSEPRALAEQTPWGVGSSRAQRALSRGAHRPQAPRSRRRALPSQVAPPSPSPGASDPGPPSALSRLVPRRPRPARALEGLRAPWLGASPGRSHVPRRRAPPPPRRPGRRWALAPCGRESFGALPRGAKTGRGRAGPKWGGADRMGRDRRGETRPLGGARARKGQSPTFGRGRRELEVAASRSPGILSQPCRTPPQSSRPRCKAAVHQARS